MGLITIYSNIKFFIFHLICILAKMVVTFEPVGIFSCSFRCCTQENKFCHLNHVFYSTLGTLWVTKKKKKNSIAVWSKTFSRIWDSPSSGNDLRNKFHFSEVHESMNAKGHEQSKWRLKGAMLTLHVTRCVHTCTSMNLRKTKFISYITLNAIILRPLAEVSFKMEERSKHNKSPG